MTKKNQQVNNPLKPLNEGLNLKPSSVMAQDGLNIKVNQAAKSSAPPVSAQPISSNSATTNIQTDNKIQGK